MSSEENKSFITTCAAMRKHAALQASKDYTVSPMKGCAKAGRMTVEPPSEDLMVRPCATSGRHIDIRNGWRMQARTVRAIVDSLQIHAVKSADGGTPHRWPPFSAIRQTGGTCSRNILRDACLDLHLFRILVCLGCRSVLGSRFLLLIVVQMYRTMDRRRGFPRCGKLLLAMRWRLQLSGLCQRAETAGAAHPRCRCWLNALAAGPKTAA